MKWFVWLLLPILLIACSATSRGTDAPVSNSTEIPIFYMFYTDN